MKRKLSFDRRLNRFIEATEKSLAEFKQSLAESRAEFNRSIAESRAEFKQSLAESRAEFDRSIAESRAEFKQMLTESNAKFDRMMAEQDMRLKKMHEEIFGVGENIGHHAEQYFQNALKSSLVFGDEQYDKMIPNLKHEGKETCEFDIVLVNGTSVALIEAKNRIHPAFISDMVEKKAAQFRKYFPEYRHYKLYLGVAGFSFDAAVVETAREYGIGILRQCGEASIESDTQNLKAY